MKQRFSAGRSDVAFAAVVLVAALIAVGLGIAFLGRASGSPPPVSTTKSASSRPLYPVGPTRAAATSVVQRNFELALAGDATAACALESPAYLRFDAQHYAGGCVGGTSAVMAQAKARGITFRLTDARVVSFRHGRATVLSTSDIAGRSIIERIYLRYHGGRWWISGAADSHRDVGY